MSITISAGVRQNLLSLQNTADLMLETQNRLATGKKVNSALDNPTNFFTSASLQGRSSDLSALLDSMSNGVKTLEAADNGLSAITKNLESMQSTLRQARQDKTFKTASFALGDIDPNAATPAQINLSGGAVGNRTAVDLTVTGAGQTSTLAAAYEAPEAAVAASYTGTVDVSSGLPAATAFTIDFDGGSVDIALEADATRDDATKLAAAINEQINLSELEGKVTAEIDGTELKLVAADTIDGTIEVSGADAVTTFGDPADATVANRPVSVDGSNGSLDFTINGKDIQILPAAATADDAVASINDQLGDDSGFEAFKEVGGKIGIRATNADAGDLNIGGADAALFGAPAESTTLKFAATVDQLVDTINEDFAGQVRASNDNGRLRLENLSTSDLKIEGKNAATSTLDGSAGESTIGGNTVRADLAKQFNELRDQMDKLADDASFNGINLLRGDNLKITFNETGTSTIDIQTRDGEAVSSANLGLSDIEADDLDADGNVDTLLDTVGAALNDIRSQSSSFGSNLSIVENRTAFTKSMMNTLQTGADNLTLADTNEEAANMLALQTRQQLSSTALSLASQADQAALRLF